MMYKIECRFANKEIISREAWEEPIRDNVYDDYVEADSKEEAIELLKQWIYENTEGDREITDDSVDLMSDGELTGKYYDFTAEEK